MATEDNVLPYLMDYELTVCVVTPAVKRLALRGALFSLRECATSRLVVVVWTQSHHVLQPEVRLRRVGNDVVILKDWVPANAASEAGLLAERSFDGSRSQRSAVAHGTSLTGPAAADRPRDRRCVGLIRLANM